MGHEMHFDKLFLISGMNLKRIFGTLDDDLFLDILQLSEKHQDW